MNTVTKEKINELLEVCFEFDPEETSWFMPTEEIIEIMFSNGLKRNLSKIGLAMLIAGRFKRIGLEKLQTQRNGTAAEKSILRGWMGIRERKEHRKEAFEFEDKVIFRFLSDENALKIYSACGINERKNIIIWGRYLLACEITETKSISPSAYAQLSREEKNNYDQWAKKVLIGK